MESDLAFRSAAFPGLLRSPVETNSRTANPKAGSELPGLRDEARTSDLESQAPAMLRMQLVGANPQAKVSGLDELPGKSNYFVGNDPKKWRTNVPNYAKVKYEGVYPGVDLVYYGNQGQLEYDFVVQPGADPRQIALDVGAGLALPKRAPQAASLHVDGNGDLVVATEGGEVTFHKPVVYQQNDDGNRHRIDGRYVLSTPQSAIDNRQSTISFELAAYDHTRPLVIDPVLVYSTYLGGSGYDAGNGIAVDASGNAYVTGTTYSSDFPTTPGAFQTTHGYYDDVFVSKLNPAGSTLIYSTYLGGSHMEGGAGIAVDASGNAYITGDTNSSNFPTTPGAFQAPGGGGFVTKLNATGSALVYSTSSIGGSAIALDAAGNTYVTGGTASSNFPTTPGAFQTTFAAGYNTNGFVSKLNPAGSALVYSTYLGGGFDYGSAIAVDALGNAYVMGETASPDFPTTPGAFQTTLAGYYDDVFVSKLNPAGSTLIYSTYLGGSSYEDGGGIAVDASSNAYVTGSTNSHDFPTTPGAFQTIFWDMSTAFVSKLNATGSALIYSTYLGGSDQDEAWGIAVDSSGNAYVTGATGSSDFPTTPGAFQTTPGGREDAFVSKLNANGSSLLYSTYLGGSDYDAGRGIAVDASGNAYVTGSTWSDSFPTTPGAFQATYGGNMDVFVAKIAFPNAPDLALAPTSLTFSPQGVGTTSPLQKVRLSDAGTKPLDITSIVASGDFAQTNDCSATVPLAGFCTLSVTFTPTTAGTRTGAVTITDNAPGSPHKLLLTGTGGIPMASLNPASLTFAAQTVGTTSPAKPATLKNTGSGPLSITSITTACDFAQTNNCGSKVNPGASCTLNITFKPKAAGTRSGALTINDDAAGSPHKLLLAGTGGATPAVSLTPASFTFPAQAVGTTSAAHVATLKNTGGTALKINGISRSGDFYQGNDCPSTLPSGASCKVTVWFTPTSAGTRSGTVTICDNAPGSPHKLALSGAATGTGSISLTLSPASLSFGSLVVGASSSPQTVTLTNTGTVAAKFLCPFGFFAIQGTNWLAFHEQSNCGSSLAPKVSCQVSVFFKPLASGTKTGYFTVRQGAASVQIPLNGTGTP